MRHSIETTLPRPCPYPASPCLENKHFKMLVYISPHTFVLVCWRGRGEPSLSRVRRSVPSSLHYPQLIKCAPCREQDTFSFSLVLLCLSLGNIGHIRTLALKKPASVRYTHGGRPRLPKSLHRACPQIVALIEEMWRADFRARPMMKDVTARLEACTFNIISGTTSSAKEVGIIGGSSLCDEVADELTTTTGLMTELTADMMSERIRELEVKNEQLEVKNEKLEVKNEQLEVQIKEQSI